MKVDETMAKQNSVLILIDELLAGAKEKLKAEKLGVGDLVRLLQLRKEYSQEELKEIKVKWVEQNGEEHEGSVTGHAFSR